MTFGAPFWFLLLPLLAAAAWIRRRAGLVRPLRVVCMVLLVVILAEPRTRSGGAGLDLWMLVDRSASARDLLEPRLSEIESILRKAAGRHDRVFFVDYSDVAMLRGESTQERFPGSPESTDTALALEYALTRIPPERAARVLVLTDGFSTSPLGNAAERVVRQNVPVDVRLVVPGTDLDYRVAALDLPQRVQVGEPFLVGIRAEGRPDGRVPFALFRDGHPVGQGTAEVRDGTASLRFSDRVARGGAYRYQVELSPEEDAFPGNNRAEAWVEVLGGPRVLVLTSYTDDPLEPVLRAQGFDVETAADPGAVHVGRLAGARAVVLNNVPAYRMDPAFLRELDVFVRVQGGGLLMAGGKYSFGSGGYFESAVDPLLPVSMELRQEHRKLSVAMAIVMDRSGSMGAGVPGGGTKMDLANEGAARCVELLGDNDALTVIAVDSRAHRIAPLVQVGKNRTALQGHIRRIASMGGGIFVYTGLNAAWEELRKAEQGQRHVILFADAADAEQPGDYRNLVARMVRGGAGVSVIGLGNETDTDAEFLKDVAARGNGRIFFNADPAELPALFAQETVAVARSAFLEEPVPVSPLPGWLELAAEPLDWPDVVDGYNLSYLRPDAAGAALASDEYNAPLVAFWQRGAGRVAAVSFPLGGDFSESVRTWTGYGDFIQTLTRWLMGEDLPAGVGLRSRLEGERLQLDLLFDETWQERFIDTPPGILVADAEADTPVETTWERIEPGRFRSSLSLTPGRRYRGAVQIGAHAVPFGPVIVGTSPEWAFEEERVEELRSVSQISGGRERLDLATAFEPTGLRGPRDLRPWFLTALLLAFLAEALQSRIGWHLPELRGAAEAGRARIQRVRRRRRSVTTPDAAGDSRHRPAREPAQPASGSHRDKAESRRARFLRAKRGK